MVSQTLIHYLAKTKLLSTNMAVLIYGSLAQHKQKNLWIPGPTNGPLARMSKENDDVAADIQTLKIERMITE